MPAVSETDARRQPLKLAILVAIAVAEALVLLGLALVYLMGLLRGDATISPGGAAFTLALLALYSVWLGASAVFLWKGYRWPRAAILVTQLLALAVGVPTLTGGYVLYGVAILIPAGAAIVLLFDRRVLAASQRTTDGGAI